MVLLSTIQIYSTNRDLRAVIYGKRTAIAITDAFTNGLTVNNIHLSMTTLAIYNEHASNSLDYSIFGHLDDNGAVEPAFDGTWVELPKDSCVTTVAPQKSKGETFTENWAWLLVRFKNTNSTVVCRTCWNAWSLHIVEIPVPDIVFVDGACKKSNIGISFVIKFVNGR